MSTDKIDPQPYEDLLRDAKDLKRRAEETFGLDFVSMTILAAAKEALEGRLRELNPDSPALLPLPTAEDQELIRTLEQMEQNLANVRERLQRPFKVSEPSPSMVPEADKPIELDASDTRLT